MLNASSIIIFAFAISFPCLVVALLALWARQDALSKNKFIQDHLTATMDRVRELLKKVDESKREAEEKRPLCSVTPVFFDPPQDIVLAHRDDGAVTFSLGGVQVIVGPTSMFHVEKDGSLLPLSPMNDDQPQVSKENMN